MALKQVVLGLVLFSIYRCRGTNIFEDADIKLEEQLKLLNKPPVATFLTEEGDTIDCVDIDKQPALDHPLLKNHKVQRKPNLPLRSPKTFSRTKYVQFGSRKPCPIGTVPIQRIKKEDLIRTRSLPKMPSANMVGNEDDPSREHSRAHRATIRHDRPDIRKYGASAYISVYNLTVAPDQYSANSIWILTGPLNRLSMIAAGWQVYPTVGGDYLSRLFTYWTGNSWRDGCFNTLCRGFVQVGRIITPNLPIKPVSTHGGPIYGLNVEVSQDFYTGNWWLRVHNWNVGYWPKELFKNLQNGTFTVAWGGVAQESADGYCPPMGNGELPDPDYRKAAFFKDLRWMNARGGSFSPREAMPVEVDAPPSCYGLLDVKLRPEPWGYYFSYGGPGGFCRA